MICGKTWSSNCISRNYRDILIFNGLTRRVGANNTYLVHVTTIIYITCLCNQGVSRSIEEKSVRFQLRLQCGSSCQSSVGYDCKHPGCTYIIVRERNTEAHSKYTCYQALFNDTIKNHRFQFRGLHLPAPQCKTVQTTHQCQLQLLN